jgi:F0F1-type ATP synthase membrane subunit c/vacuolar-type H+-ATPase subunit K
MWRGYWYRFGSLITAVARNPSLTKQLFSYSILGFALTETLHYSL